MIWSVKLIHSHMLCGWSHGNVVDFTLSNKDKFMHLYAAFLQLILFTVHFSLYLKMLHCLVHFDSPLVLLRNC